MLNRKPFVLLFILLLGLQFAPATWAGQVAQTWTPQQVAKNVFPSVVLLVMEDSNGQALSLGSGFIVGDQTVATNLHVIEGASRGYAKIIGEEKKYEVEGAVGIDLSHDLALLRIPAKGLRPLPIGDADAIEIGDTVYVVGNPQGLEGTFSLGIISGLRHIGEDSILQITAPISPGSSGGPVLNNQGKVIGIAVATFKDGQNLNFAIPVSYLKTLSSNQVPLLPLNKATTSKTISATASALGERNTDGVEVVYFEWTDNQFMGEYSFSVRNKLRQPIKLVGCLVIFYGKDGFPIESEYVWIDDTIGAGLAKRTKKLGRISADEVRNLTKRVEIRVIDFTLLD